MARMMSPAPMTLCDVRQSPRHRYHRDRLTRVAGVSCRRSAPTCRGSSFDCPQAGVRDPNFADLDHLAARLDLLACQGREPLIDQTSDHADAEAVGGEQ